MADDIRVDSPNYVDRPHRRVWIAAVLIAAGGVCAFVATWLTYAICRIDVGPDQFAVLIRKTGKDLKNADEVAPDDTYKGVQKKVLTTGRYFYNPYDYEWEIKPLIEIKTGKLGVRVSLTGEDLREPFHRLTRRLVIHEQRRGPVAARHDAGQVHHQADVDAGEIDGVEMAFVDADAGPGLATVLGRRMIAEREDAGTEHRATARQRHLAFQGPGFGQDFTPTVFIVQLRWPPLANGR